MPAVMPGTMRNGTPRARQRLGFLAAAAEHEGIAAFQPQHAVAFSGQLHQQIGNLVLLAGAARRRACRHRSSRRRDSASSVSSTSAS